MTTTAEAPAETSKPAEIYIAKDKFVLNALDRCDACGAAAYYQVRLNTGSELMFCVHHYRNNEEKLLPISSFIRDESARLRLG